MTTDLPSAFAATWHRIEAEVLGKPSRFTRRENDWVIDFGDRFGFCVESMWRIRGPEGIALVDTDNGQVFGLPAPVDAEAEANKIVADSQVVEFTFDSATADLKFHLSSGLIIEVFSNSTGYESWQAYVGGELVAVGGSYGLR